MIEQKLAPLFANNISKIKIDKLIKSSNILSLNNNSNHTSFYQEVDLKLKGLNKYNDILNLYISNNNNMNLILKIKNDQFSNLDNGLLSIEKKMLLNKSNEVLHNDKNLEIAKIEELNKEFNTQINSNYLKSLSKFNSLSKGQIITYSQQIHYNFNSGNNVLFKKIYSLLLNSFISMNCLISKPVFEITSERVIIHLFIYLFKKNKEINKNNKFINVNWKKLNLLCTILSNFFKKTVILDLNRIYYPYFDSNIFVNFLANIINKIQIRNITKNFFKKAIIKNPFKLDRKLIVNKFPSLLSGINIKIAGRLLTTKIVPRKTIKNVRRGALARIKINYLDIARYTNKNKRGAFSITITTGQFLT
jgi:hypothetical protein